MTYSEFVHAARSDQFWMGFIPAALVALSSLLALFRHLMRMRLIADTPVSLVRSATQGYVELQGIARMMAGKPIVSPLSGRRCVWYRYTVEEKSGSKDGWETVERDQSTAIFHLDDGTGRCIVDPEGAEVIPSKTRQWRGNSLRPGDAPRNGSFWDRLARADRYRYTESLIEEEDPLYVMGTLKALASGDPGTTDDAIRRIVRGWKQNPAALRERFDKNQDGLISSEEWEHALNLAEREAMLNWHRTAAEAEVNLIGKPVDGRPFLLSTLPEHLLRNRFRRLALVSAVLFLLFGAGAGWALYLRYGSHG